MAEKEKPDNIVYDADKKTYDAFLKPYATTVGAPVITTNDTVAWKNRSINKLNHKVKTRFQELKAQYELLMHEFEDNKLINEAKFSFEPVIGQRYHLYARENGEKFLSLIAPSECTFNFLGSFHLNADQIWERLLD